MKYDTFWLFLILCFEILYEYGAYHILQFTVNIFLINQTRSAKIMFNGLSVSFNELQHDNKHMKNENF